MPESATPDTPPARVGASNLLFYGLGAAGLVMIAFALKPMGSAPSTASTPIAVSASPASSQSPVSAPLEVGPPVTLKVLLTPAVSGTARFNGDKVDFRNGKVEYELRPGSWHVEIAAPNYHSQERDLAITDTTPEPLSLELIPLAGSLKVQTTPSDCHVFLDGKEIGTSSNTGKLVAGSVKVGRHKLKVSHDGYDSVSKQVEVKSDGVALATVALTATYVAPPPSVGPAPAPGPAYYNPGPAPAPAPYYPPAPAPAPPPADPYNF